jgi:hypothetical protein
MIRCFLLALLGLTAALLATTAAAVPPRPPNLPTPPIVLYYLSSIAPLKTGITAAKLKAFGVTDVSILLTDNQLNLYSPGIDRAEVRRRCQSFAAAAKPLRWHAAGRIHSDLSLAVDRAPYTATGFVTGATWEWYLANLKVVAEEVKAAGGTGWVQDDEPYIPLGLWRATPTAIKTQVPQRAEAYAAVWKAQGLHLRHCAPWGKVWKLTAWPAFWRKIHALQPATVFLGEETYTNAHNPPIIPTYARQYRESLGASAKIAFGLSPTQPKYASDPMRRQFIRREGCWLFSYPRVADPTKEPLTTDPKAAPVLAAIRYMATGK